MVALKQSEELRLKQREEISHLKAVNGSLRGAIADHHAHVDELKGNITSLNSQSRMKTLTVQAQSSKLMQAHEALVAIASPCGVSYEENVSRDYWKDLAFRRMDRAAKAVAKIWGNEAPSQGGTNGERENGVASSAGVAEHRRSES